MRFPGKNHTTLVVVVTSIVILVMASPVAARWIGTWRTNWNLIGNVGQAYGFASALLSGLALLSIGTALFYQARQTKATQLQAARTMQLELFALAYNHPDLQAGWSRSIDVPYPEWRKRTYINLVFQYLRMSHLIGELPDRDLRRALANRFKTQLGRDYWSSAQEAMTSAATGRRDRKFVEIANREYLTALHTAPLSDQDNHRPTEAESVTVSDSVMERNPGFRNLDPKVPIAFAAGCATMFITHLVLRRSQIGRQPFPTLTEGDQREQRPIHQLLAEKHSMRKHRLH